MTLMSVAERRTPCSVSATVLQGGASLGLLRLCFAKLLASLVGQPDAFGAGESRDATKRASRG